MSRILHYSIYLTLAFLTIGSSRHNDILYKTAKLVDAKQSEPESWIAPRPTASGSQQFKEGSIGGKPFLLNGGQTCYLNTKCISDTLKEGSQNTVVVDMQELAQVCTRCIRLASKTKIWSSASMLKVPCKLNYRVGKERRGKPCDCHTCGLRDGLIEESSRSLELAMIIPGPP